MSRSEQSVLIDAAWNDVLRWLPPNLDQMAKEEFGFRRRGSFQTAADVLRMALAYSVCDLSLRSTAAWLTTRGLGDISDVAVLGRLRRAQTFLARALASLLAMRVQRTPCANVPYKVRMLDGTCVSAPGATGAEWRIHATFDAARGVVDCIELTTDKGGEHLERSNPQSGDLLVADRGYAHARRLLAIRTLEAHFLIRIGHNAVPMVDEKGLPFDPLAFAKQVRKKHEDFDVREAPIVYLRADTARSHPLRLILVRKSGEATQRDRRRTEKSATKKGKIPTQRTLDATAFVFLLTSVHAVSKETLAQLYRVRWQIEVNFKRWKSIFDLDLLRADDPDLARAYIYSKLIATCLADTLSCSARAFSPWGLPLAPADMASGSLA